MGCVRPAVQVRLLRPFILRFMKPTIHRGPLRRFLGKQYYWVKKQWQWYRMTGSCAQQEETLLPHIIFHHQTPLRRPLRGDSSLLQDNKIHNIALSIPRLNKRVLRPGEQLSYWRAIGNPTKKKGYKAGMVLYEGKVTSGIGGGLCQLSNLLYWMTLHTPLTVTERWRHSYDVFPDINRTQPFGSGATCAYPNIDLQIKNNTEQTFQLVLSTSDTHLIGEWRSNKPQGHRYVIREAHPHIIHETCGGYTRHNTLMRDIYNIQTGELVMEECVTTNHACMMYDPLLPA